MGQSKAQIGALEKANPFRGPVRLEPNPGPFPDPFPSPHLSSLPPNSHLGRFRERARLSKEKVKGGFSPLNHDESIPKPKVRPNVIYQPAMGSAVKVNNP